MNKRIILIICMLGTIGLGYANNFAVEDNLTVQAHKHSGADRSSSISASINGHYLNVVFTDNLGEVSIEITTDTYVSVSFETIHTPTGYQLYIPDAGRYIVIFTLDNGDEYYAEFGVED